MRFPKPPKRAAKAPKKPLRRKRKGKRASLARECDRLWSRIVHARGISEISGSPHHLQAAHGYPRTYRATRWLPINGFLLTRAEHVYYTWRPLEWHAYLLKAWGPNVYEELWHLATANAKQDMPSVLAKLREEANRLGLS